VFGHGTIGRSVSKLGSVSKSEEKCANASNARMREWREGGGSVSKLGRSARMRECVNARMERGGEVSVSLKKF
jgi:hypothetical protein